jgi:hypothetical protein
MLTSEMGDRTNQFEQSTTAPHKAHSKRRTIPKSDFLHY